MTRDRWLQWSLRACAATSGLVVVLIILFLVAESTSGIRAIGLGRFFRDPGWHPDPDAADGAFNLAPMLVGSLIAMLGSVLLATPIGIASALFCRFYAPRVIAGAYRRIIELLAGVPSVVYGFWGLVVLVPIIRQVQPPGSSLLAGILVLAIMILPTIALTSYAAFTNVPSSLLDAAAAAGLGRWGTIRAVVFPSARSGLYTGVILETGRAIGETMAVLMVCGNVVQVPGSVFEPVRTLTANIALELGYAMDDHRAALFVSGMLLIVVVVALVVAAELIGRGRVHG